MKEVLGPQVGSLENALGVQLRQRPGEGPFRIKMPVEMMADGRCGNLVTGLI